jgi:hypothetical protein
MEIYDCRVQAGYRQARQEQSNETHGDALSELQEEVQSSEKDDNIQVKQRSHCFRRTTHLKREGILRDKEDRSNFLTWCSTWQYDSVTTLKEALETNEWKNWERAIQNVLDSVKRNQMTLMKLPEGRKGY